MQENFKGNAYEKERSKDLHIDSKRHKAPIFNHQRNTSLLLANQVILERARDKKFHPVYHQPSFEM